MYHITRSFPAATTEEQRAMAHRHWGPFQTYAEAVSTMADGLRHESAAIKNLNPHSILLAERAGRFVQAADMVIEHGLTRVHVDGVLFNIKFTLTHSKVA